MSGTPIRVGVKCVWARRIFYDGSRKLNTAGPTRSPRPMRSGCGPIKARCLDRPLDKLSAIESVDILPTGRALEKLAKQWPTRELVR
jgi:hypothetical protein